MPAVAVATAAIVVAAGPGTRLGAGIPKAFVLLRGRPLFAHSLRAILSATDVNEAVLVVPSGQVDEAERLLATAPACRVKPHVLEGGAERQDSVRLGLAALGDPELVAIHDAARPFVSRTAVEAAIAAARQHGAAIVAVPATDTIKQVHAEGWIAATPDRQHLWLAQTPQVFRVDVLREAYRRFPPGTIVTDDASLVEYTGSRVYVVRGNVENRKITTPEDLEWAEWMLSRPATPR